MGFSLLMSICCILYYFPLYQFYTFYMFYTAIIFSFRVFRVFRGSNCDTLSRGPLRPFGFASLRQPDAFGAGASVPGLEHTLSPRGVCSRILHPSARLTQHVPFQVHASNVYHTIFGNSWVTSWNSRVQIAIRSAPAPPHKPHSTPGSPTSRLHIGSQSSGLIDTETARPRMSSESIRALPSASTCPTKP